MYLLTVIISGKTGHCCYEKKVGGSTYTLLHHSAATRAYGCVDQCVYQAPGGAAVCFRRGSLPVTCVREFGKTGLTSEGITDTSIHAQGAGVGLRRAGIS